MKVITVPQFGGPEVLAYGDAPRLPLGAGQARVRVERSGVNYGDVVLRSGRAFDVPRPFVPGVEAAGVIEELAADAGEQGIGDGIEVGARVAVPLFTAGRLDGGYASEVVFEARRLVRIPDDVSYEAAIALQVQGISAWLLCERVPVEGRTVLVHAGAGGSGSLLIQVARARGAARVLATASTEEKRALVRELGADAAIDYTDAAWPAQVLAATDSRGADVIVDSVGGLVRRRSFEALAAGGTLVLFGYSSEIGGDAGAEGEGFDAATVRGLFFKRQTVTSSLWTDFEDPGLARRTMQRLFELVQRGALRVITGATFSLSRAADAHRALASRATTGKLCLAPGER